MPGPLAGIRVVDVSQILSGPWACMILADQGADVVKVESPGLGDPMRIGPYRRGGAHSAPSNEEFDRSLRARDPQWGVRDLDEVEFAAEGEGLVLDQVIDMPVNNLSVVFRKRA